MSGNGREIRWGQAVLLFFPICFVLSGLQAVFVDALVADHPAGVLVLFANLGCSAAIAILLSRPPAVRPDDQNTKVFQWKLSHLMIFVAVVAAFSAAAVAIVQHAKQVRTASRASLLTTDTIHWVSDFVWQHHRWPKSWEDLEAGIGRDTENARELVFVDFGFEIEKVLQLDANSFDAIRPKDFDYQHRGMNSFLILKGAVEKRLGGQKATNTSPLNEQRE